MSHATGSRSRPGSSSGADGARTRGLQRATLALSQLSYGPNFTAKCSREIEIEPPTYPSPLVVPCRRQTELQYALTVKCFKRDEVRRVEFEAVGRDGVDLIARVTATGKAICGPSARVATDDYDVAISRCPFALHTHEFRPQIEDQVVSLSVGQRLEHANVELARLMGDCKLGNRSLLVRREHFISVVVTPDDVCCRNGLRRCGRDFQRH